MRKKLSILLWLFLVFFITKASSVHIRCNKIGKCSVADVTSSSCCTFAASTAINASDFTISTPANRDVDTLTFSGNRKVKYLPLRSFRRFPGLRNYLAENCSILEIWWKNFEKLDNLTRIDLSGNQIESIRSDTFYGLENLKFVDLSRNRINFMNGKLFENLAKLENVNVAENSCINMNFGNPINYELLSRRIIKNCGFDEPEYSEKEVKCKTVEKCMQGLCCYLRDEASIDSKDFTIANRDANVEMLKFFSNSKVEFLPVNVYKSFPNLVSYEAHNCSIREITKKNFERLNRLRTIALWGNFIEIIKADTFEGLVSLINIDLESNKILNMNGRLFENLPMLDWVDLRDNQCINGLFETPEAIAVLSRNVTESCAFTDTGETDFVKVVDTECGVIKYGTGYILGGTETRPGQWPFLAAILRASEGRFLCAGNLISSRHILTAAHCIQQKFIEAKANLDDLAVVLGRHELNSSAIGAQRRNVERVIVHPSWKTDEMKYDADIALLVLNEDVEFTEFVQPVCLTASPEIMNCENGYVVGWGKTETSERRVETSRQALLRAVNDSVCFERDPALGRIFTLRMFCAGGSGAGPCAGDSGGGFFVRFKGLWSLRGTVSSGAFTTAGGCDAGRYALFTKIIDYTDWIKNEVAESFLALNSSSQVTGNAIQRHAFT